MPHIIQEARITHWDFHSVPSAALSVAPVLMLSHNLGKSLTLGWQSASQPLRTQTTHHNTTAVTCLPCFHISYNAEIVLVTAKSTLNLME